MEVSKNTLRVREIRDQGSPSFFKNVDLGGEKGRGDASSSISRSIGENKVECITFIPDTEHNRAQVLTRRVEVSTNAEGSFKRIDPSEIDDIFAPCEDAIDLPGDPRIKPAAPVPEASMGLVGYLKLPKTEQVRLVGEVPKEALLEILACNDDRLAPKAKADAKKRLDRMEAEASMDKAIDRNVASGVDGTKDAGPAKEVGKKG